ncbi:hypothetical protein ACWF9B_02735 [Streptomyces sp. NPDC055089]
MGAIRRDRPPRTPSFSRGITPVRLVVSERHFQHGSVGPIPRTPAQTTANLAALATDKREAVVTAYALAADLLADLLADMGAHQPYLLTPEGDIQLGRRDGHHDTPTGWYTDRPRA